jgi:hypothetical protein
MEFEISQVRLVSFTIERDMQAKIELYLNVIKVPKAIFDFLLVHYHVEEFSFERAYDFTWCKLPIVQPLYI